MKRIICFTFCLLLTSLSRGQSNSRTYQDLKKKGDSLYRARDYQQAAVAFAKVLQLPAEKFTIWDWHRAAFAYALTPKADSAFYFLDVIAGMDSIRTEDYIDVADDRDFNSIRKDKRWKDFNDKAFAKARQTYYKNRGPKDVKSQLQETKQLAVAFAFNNQPDSAFYHLYQYAGSSSLNFPMASETVKDGYFRRLHKDPRWPELKNKIYGNVATGMADEIRKLGDKADNLSRRQTAIAWANSSRPDSAFYQLNQVADSKMLTFADVFFIITDGEFSNVTTYSEFSVLENDPRWARLKEKLFRNLYTKYFPENSFARTKRSKKRMLIDGGHFNLHDIEGTYAPLAGPLLYCGIEATGIKGKIDASILSNTHLLLISNPNPDREDSIARRAQRAGEPLRWSAAATQPGYTRDEVLVIHDWVQQGGSLFLILDHAPFGKVGEALAAAFGIENRNVATYDSLHTDPVKDSTGGRTILFTRSKGFIGNHPIVNGIESVTTSTGESLVGPPGSSVLLHLPATAYDQDWLPETRKFRYRSAEGRSQGVAFEYGKGRVVMLGEAAVTRPASISRTDNDNWKFVLNILRWLVREI